MTNVPAKPTPAKEPQRRPLAPGVATWTIVALCLALVVILHATEILTDIAVVHIASLILTFIAATTLLIWFAFRSGFPGWLRLATVVVLAITFIVVGSLFRIEGVSGGLIPKFVYRFARAKDYSLTPPPAAAPQADRVDLATTTAADFPQFLGKDRNAVVTDVSLEHDWTAHPPKLVWKQPIGAGWSGFAAVNGFAVTLEQRGDKELVSCYEVATGKLRWSHEEPARHQTVLGGIGPRSTPTIHGGRVYTVGATGIALCLDGSNGEVVWRVDMPKLVGSDSLTEEQSEVFWGRAGSPLIVDDLVVLPGGGKGKETVSLIALKQVDGKEIWRGGNRQISYASPALATLCGVRQILSVNEAHVSGHDPATGEVLWEAAWPGDSTGSASASQPQTPGGDRVLLSKGYFVGAKLLQVSKNDEGFQVADLWEQYRTLLTKFTNVAIVDRHIYGLSEGVLECVELDSGKTAWKGRRRGKGDYGPGQVLAVGDVLLVQAENGDVALVEASPRALNELGRIAAIQGQTWNNLCLTGKYLLVRNGEEAACYELTVAEP